MPRLVGTQNVLRWRTSTTKVPVVQCTIPQSLIPGKARRTVSTLNFQHLDKKWQQIWKLDQAKRKSCGKEKEYVLAMFPYPSGNLHMGHVRVYTIADVLARFKRMQGREVIYPMGWDAFGLPAENAAIERGLDPAEWTRSNIAKMKEQIQGMNTDIDWSRELVTCEPDFYKHTQRIFLLLHEHGLAYQAKSLVNYDPIDQTVLANEQVDGNGFSWRSGAKVEKLNLKQWFFKITEFKEALLEDLNSLDRWPERVKSMQQNWLGRSQGTRLSFEIRSVHENTPQSVSVFTTRLDTLFGVQFLALSSSHPLVLEHAKHDPKLQSFIDAMPSLPPDSKAGYRLQGVSAKSPLSQLVGIPQFVHEPLEVWVAPYVKGDHGDGAIMGVPAHDTRDFSFWKANCNDVPIRRVVHELDKDAGNCNTLEDVITSPGLLTESCGPFSGLTSKAASEMIFKKLTSTNSNIERHETWRLRDWLISRQRYWGAPIPIIHCKSCGAVPVPVEDLPVKLPELEPETFKHRKGNPLEKAGKWLNVECPKCKAPAKRDTDTMDTFVDSSWYMFRFLDSNDDSRPFAVEKVDNGMPVDIYIGGIEHAILHLLYARFIGKALAKFGMWPAGASSEINGEPFKQLISQGMVHGKTYSDPDTGRFLKPDEVDLSQPTKPLVKTTQKPAQVSFEKMSKSKHNGVDPSDFIQRYGADVSRVHMLFQAPVSDVLEWEEDRIVGVSRWLQRLYKHIESVSKRIPTRNEDESHQSLNLSTLSQPQAETILKTERTIVSITSSLTETYSLNTCISDLMSLTNDILSSEQSLTSEQLHHTASVIIRLVSPFAPAFAEECWETLHTHHSSSSNKIRSVFNQPWPKAENLVELEDWAKTKLKIPCAIMENGKLRMVLDFDPLPKELEGAARLDWAMAQMREHESGRIWLDRKSGNGGWKKVIVVNGGKAVNFVGDGKLQKTDGTEDG